MFFTLFKWKAAQRFYEIWIHKHVCIFIRSLWQEQRGGMRGGGQAWEGAEGWIMIVVGQGRDVHSQEFDGNDSKEGRIHTFD